MVVVIVVAVVTVEVEVVMVVVVNVVVVVMVVVMVVVVVVVVIMVVVAGVVVMVVVLVVSGLQPRTELALANTSTRSVTFPMSQARIFWLKDTAWENIRFMLTTLPVCHVLTSCTHTRRQIDTHTHTHEQQQTRHLTMASYPQQSNWYCTIQRNNLVAKRHSDEV